MERTEYAITRRLDDAMEAIEKQFDIPYCDEDFYQALRTLENSDRGNWYANLDVLINMIRACGYQNKIREDAAFPYYREQVLELIEDGNIMTSVQLSEKVRGICEELYRRYRDFPTPTAYMQRLVDSLCNPEDPWKEDSLRLRILKQFIKYGGSLTCIKGCNQKAICDYIAQRKGVEAISSKALLAALNDGSLTDEIFSLLQTLPREIIKEKYRLLTMADRLASGNFVLSGGTKQDLYLFAICFGMTFAAHPGAKAVAEESRDIEYHLFTDYYAANVLMYLSEAYQKDPDNTVIDPSGTSINFKNYAELIYLYYICQPLTPIQKLKGASAMLKAVQKAAKETAMAGEESADQQPGATIKLKERVLGKGAEDPLSLPEEKFMQFLLDNYDCRPVNGSPFIVNDCANTATEEYLAVVKRLQDRVEASFADFKDIPELADAVYRYGLFFDDEFAQGIGGDPAQDAARQDFQTILHLVNTKLLKDEELIKKCRPENVKPNTVTRTKLLAVLYYDFNDRHISANTKRHGASLRKHYMQFCKEINPVLERCNFTRLSPKSLLDMLLIFSSYVCINE